MGYHPATSEARHITTRLRLDADKGLERLAEVSRLLRQDTPDVIAEMRRLWREEKDARALQYLERYEKTLRDLGSLMSELGTEHVDPSTIGAEHRVFRQALIATRLNRANPSYVNSGVSDDFLTDPTTVD